MNSDEILKCANCGNELTNKEYPLFMISDNPSIFIQLCDKCAKERIEEIRKMMGMGDKK